MKKFQFILLFLILLFNWALICQPLSGDKIIGSVGDYPSLSIAITELNNHGISGTLRFLIDENLLESGTGLVINRADLTNVNNLIIKPNIGKSPTITITNFALFGSVEQAFTINNSSFITIDGSNTEDGLTRDLTIIGNDNTASQAYLIGVINNSDNITIKNLKLKKNNMPSNSSGITLDGEITPVPEHLVII